MAAWPACGSSGKTHDLTGAFIANLATFYNDSRWKLFDNATGRIYVTDTQAAFQAAAQPNVPAAYYNHCVEGKMSYVGGGISRTYLIPVTPVALTSGTGSIGMSGVGVALNGITMDPPAPVDRIKAAFTIAAFDDCGGHINPVEATTITRRMGCGYSSEHRWSAALIGYALDGFGSAMLDAAGGDRLDSTGAHRCAAITIADRCRREHVHRLLRGRQGTVRDACCSRPGRLDMVPPSSC
jgi:hypothetical protein